MRISLIILGVTVIIGGISGNLAGMIGALFDPQDLTINQGGTANGPSIAQPSPVVPPSNPQVLA